MLPKTEKRITTKTKQKIGGIESKKIYVDLAYLRTTNLDSAIIGSRCD